MKSNKYKNEKGEIDFVSVILFIVMIILYTFIGIAIGFLMITSYFPLFIKIIFGIMFYIIYILFGYIMFNNINIQIIFLN